MKDINYEIRVMTIDDYDEVYGLWQTIHGFGIPWSISFAIRRESRISQAMMKSAPNSSALPRL